ncbi:MAG: glycosyltransferase family 4 protein [Acidimicrobiales bacterium]
MPARSDEENHVRASNELAKMGDIAAAAGIRFVHILAWRDLDDVEAGGSEVHAATVAKLWAEAGIQVVQRTSYAQGRPPHAARDGYEVIRRAGRYLVFPRAVGSELLGRHGRRDALVEVWNGMPFFSPLWARGPSVVLLHHVHAEMWNMVLGEDAPALARAGELLERRIAPLAYRNSRIVTLSESSKADIVQRLGLRAAQIDVVAPGVDDRFSPGGSRTEHASLVAVGRLVPVKRYDLLIRAAAHTRETRPDLTLTIVGTGYEREALQSLMRELDADDWVTLAGGVSDAEVVALYRSSWLAVSASAREGWGMSLTEAAACATPAVATRIAGHLDAVAEGVSGVLADGNVAALGGAIAHVLSDDALRARLSRGALEHAQRLTWAATATGIMRSLASTA